MLRSPIESPTPRMQPLARLPVFYALQGKRVVVAGGNFAAAWKAELLSAAGAQVEVFAVDCGDEMQSVIGDPPQGTITFHSRPWQARDMEGAAMAIAACEDDDEAARFAAAARGCGVPVNVIDKPAYCDFSFGAIVNRSPLVIGISTDGAAPVFGQAIRAKIEAMIPQGFARWAEAARQWRSALKVSGLSFNARCRFWQIFTARALADPHAHPSDDDYAALLRDTRAEGAAPDEGSVTLVGAGPGDPEMLTLRAVRALQSADIILIDDLVSPAVIDFARREAKKMMVGKTGFGPSCKQQEINTLMVGLAKSGKRVVRLKGGDPMIFGRAGEEIEACCAAGLRVEIVPGISAAQAAARVLETSLTHRREARRVQYITGHADNGRLPDDIDWAALADPAATTIVYMPKKTLTELTDIAIGHGLDPATPAAAVIDATRPQERVVIGTAADIASRLGQIESEGRPTIVILGKVVSLSRFAAIQSDVFAASSGTLS